jgi:FAD/FMN-containing dehydrogenase
VNFTPDPDTVRAAYDTAKYERLRAVKRQNDPVNLFRLNQNIQP